MRSAIYCRLLIIYSVNTDAMHFSPWGNQLWTILKPFCLLTFCAHIYDGLCVFAISRASRKVAMIV